MIGYCGECLEELEFDKGGSRVCTNCEKQLIMKKTVQEKMQTAWLVLFVIFLLAIITSLIEVYLYY